MNLLTAAVGAGLLVLNFQDGHLYSLFGFLPIGGFEESNLVLPFVVASHTFFINEFGLATALAVAIDATVVRAPLVPARMGLPGERVWWARRPRRRPYARAGQHEGGLEGAHV